MDDRLREIERLMTPENHGLYWPMWYALMQGIHSPCDLWAGVPERWNVETDGRFAA